ncbi:hypothetical protein C4J81_04215 [Deltaproteobacteria bacterium Smac51]|nr:hypothetical protein C4J81_04215 [Deltaproteobacteria bacterium Smac51]
MVKKIRSMPELEALIDEIGFLPFFANEISRFSIEERISPKLWFAGNVDGPWEWKGPIIRNGRCAYGKLFQKKAGFVSLDWLPHLVNYRRDGYDFKDRYDDGLASYLDRQIYDTLVKHGHLRSTDLKRICGAPKGFDTSLTRLQMQTYITISDFLYAQDKYGMPYGWGIAQYETLESLYSVELVTSSYDEDPEESGRLIFEHLKGLCPKATESQLKKIIG